MPSNGPTTVRAPGAYPDAPQADDMTAPAPPTADEAKAALDAAEEALAQAQATGNTTLINRAVVGLDRAQRAYEEALASESGRRIEIPWGGGKLITLRPSAPDREPATGGEPPPNEEPADARGATWMWVFGLLLAACGVGGAVWYARRDKPMPNPVESDGAPTGDDLESNAVITYQRDEFFVHIQGREIGYFPTFDEAFAGTREAEKGLKVYYLEDESVSLLSKRGETVKTWPWKGWD